MAFELIQILVVSSWGTHFGNCYMRLKLNNAAYIANNMELV